MIAEMDWCVGELLKKLEELGIREKTLLVFSSDNGPVLDDGYRIGPRTERNALFRPEPNASEIQADLRAGQESRFLVSCPGLVRRGAFQMP